jgi:hypothetical protein
MEGILMDYIIYYIQIGLLANFIAFIVSILIAVYLTLNLDIVEIRKLALMSEQKREDLNYLDLLGYLIPFYELYLIIIKIILINRYYEKTADSIDYIIDEVQKHNLFRRKE